MSRCSNRRKRSNLQYNRQWFHRSRSSGLLNRLYRYRLATAIEIMDPQIAEVFDIRPQLLLRISCHSSMLSCAAKPGGRA